MGLRSALGTFTDTLFVAGEKLAQTTIGKHVGRLGGALNRVETKLIKAEQKVDQKVGQQFNSCAENVVEHVVPGKVLSKVDRRLAKETAKGASKAAQSLNYEVPLNTTIIAENVKQELSESQKFLENFAKEFFAESKTEIEALKAKFGQYDKINDKWLKLDFEHVFGMDVAWTKKGKPSMGGFHHDAGSKVLKSEVFDFADKVVCDHGFWKAKVFYKGDFVKEATFFPSDWSREKVVNKIFEAYGNAIKNGAELILNDKGKYRIVGLTNEGIEIEMYITQKGHIKTVYPLFGK